MKGCKAFVACWMYPFKTQGFAGWPSRVSKVGPVQGCPSMYLSQSSHIPASQNFQHTQRGSSVCATPVVLMLQA